MASARSSDPIRIVAGEIESGLVTNRILIPNSAQPVWPPFRRVAEGIATRGRRLPTHAHEQEEVLTYVIEGFATYELEGRPADQMARGSARLLTTHARAVHRISPADGASIRWFNLVVALPPPRDGPGRDRLQVADPAGPDGYIDEVEVRRLTGPGAPMQSGVGLECEILAFPQPGTTFRKVGSNRRAVVYALTGRGSVNDRPIEAGESALVDGLPGIGLGGQQGFQAVMATALRKP